MIKNNNFNNALTALIIDDENDICFLLSNILKKNDLSVHYVNTIREGIEYMNVNKTDVLFLDNYLPDGYGIDYISQFKEQHVATKIVMVTAHDSPDDRKRAFQQGVNVFIAKPFSSIEITEALNNLYEV